MLPTVLYINILKINFINNTKTVGKYFCQGYFNNNRLYASKDYLLVSKL